MAELFFHEYVCEECGEDYTTKHSDDCVYEDVCPYCGFKDNIPYDIDDMSTQDE